MNSCAGVYESFAQARSRAPQDRPLGYDAAESQKWYLNKHEALQIEDYPVVFWLREAFGNGSSVFEIGGHVGVAYYGFEQVLRYPASLKWTICDVPSVTAAGVALAKERGRNNLFFVNQTSEVDGADIVLAAGALQYVDTPSLAESIAAFKRRPGHILINTTPVYDGPSFVTLQYIGTAYCPYRIFNRDELVGSLEKLGYSAVASWRKERVFRIPGYPDKSFDHYSGFYFRAVGTGAS